MAQPAPPPTLNPCFAAMEFLGIDIGGSGIKAAIVNPLKGELLCERFRIPTPSPATPDSLCTALGHVIEHFSWKGPIGCGFPGVVRNQQIFTAANLHPSLIGLRLDEHIRERTGNPMHVINDADAAGLAEAAFGAGRGRSGSVLVITVGTGVGSALVHDGRLVPNTEFGHVRMKDKKSGKNVSAEKLVSDSARQALDLDWETWAVRFNRYLHHLHMLLWPELIIVGGGIVKKADKWLPLIDPPTEFALATLQNHAGIVGAALAASHALPEFAKPKKRTK